MVLMSVGEGFIGGGIEQRVQRMGPTLFPVWRPALPRHCCGSRLLSYPSLLGRNDARTQTTKQMDNVMSVSSVCRAFMSSKCSRGDVPFPR